MLPSARGLPLHAHGPLLFRLLHGLFGAAAAVEEQQIPRVLIKIALAGLEHGDHVFLRLILGVNKPYDYVLNCVWRHRLSDLG